MEGKGAGVSTGSVISLVREACARGQGSVSVQSREFAAFLAEADAGGLSIFSGDVYTDAVRAAHPGCETERPVVVNVDMGGERTLSFVWPSAS